MTMEAAEILESLRAELRAKATKWRTRDEAAEYCRCAPSTISMLVAKGILKARYLAGRDPRFHVKDLDALMSEKKESLHGSSKDLKSTMQGRGHCRAKDEDASGAAIPFVNTESDAAARPSFSVL